MKDWNHLKYGKIFICTCQKMLQLRGSWLRSFSRNCPDSFDGAQDRRRGRLWWFCCSNLERLSKRFPVLWFLFGRGGATGHYLFLDPDGSCHHVRTFQYISEAADAVFVFKAFSWNRRAWKESPRILWHACHLRSRSGGPGARLRTTSPCVASDLTDVGNNT